MQFQKLKIRKINPLGVIHFVLGLLLCVLGIQWLIPILSLNVLAATNYIFPFTMLAIGLVSIFVAYKYVTDAEKNSRLLLIFSLAFLHLIFWAGIIVGSYFLPPQIFYIAAVIVSGLIFYFLLKLGRNVAIIFTAVTIFAIGFSAFSNFEESYCWNQGDIAAKKAGAVMTKATADDGEKLHGFGVKEGDTIGIAFRTHMLCHETFSWQSAIQDLFSF